jgi:PIN domain nuclease of toxin-antitoxin system
VRLLLDTCTFLWLSLEPGNVSSKVREAFENRTNDVFFSIASAWEISIKYQLGRIGLPESPDLYIPARAAIYQLTMIDIDMRHALFAGALPLHHKDPFDRMLVAQAQIEGLTVMTPDTAFAPYGVSLFW